MTMTTMLAIPDLLGPSAVTGLGGMLISGWVKGAVILAVTVGVARWIRDEAAALRHLIWTVGLGVAVMLPAAESALPSWHVLPDLELPAVSWSAPSGGEVRTGAMATRSVEPEPTGSGAGTTATAEPGPAGTARLPSAVASGNRAPGEPDRSGGVGWSLLLVAGWAAGALVLLARVAVGRLRVRRLWLRSEPVTSPGSERVLASVRKRLGIARPVRVRWSGESCMPMTWGIVRPRLLLPREARSWSADRLRNVVLHELAHVRRRDPAAQLLGEVARAIHWPDPLAWIAVRALEAERERACDDRVILAGARPSSYARDLLDVARDLGLPRGTAPAAVPMARTPELGERLKALLDEGRKRERPRAPIRAAALLAGGALMVLVSAAAPAAPDRTPGTRPGPEASGEGAAAEPVLPVRGDRAVPDGDPDVGPLAVAGDLSPAQSVPVCAFRPGGGLSTNVQNRDEELRVTWSRDDCVVELEIRGEIRFGEDDRHIVSVEDGAYLELEERDDDRRRRIVVEAGAGGEPTYRYWVDRQERSDADEGRAWLRQVLPEVFRHTTYRAEERVRRILDEDGVEGVLAEVERIFSDHVAARYLTLLTERTDLDGAQARELLDVASRRLDSDHYLHGILVTVADRTGLSPEVRAAFLDAADGLDSDHYHHRVLMAFLEAPDPAPGDLERVLASSLELDSDHYRARVLGAVVASGRLGASAGTAFVRALDGMDSDHYVSRVLVSFLESGRLQERELVRVLELTRTLDSDHFRRQVLVRVAETHDLSGDAARRAFLTSAREIESDHHLTELISTVLERGEAAPARVKLVLELAATLSSDVYRARTLVSLAGGSALSGEDRRRYLELAEGIGSRTYRDRAVAALARAEAVR